MAVPKRKHSRSRTRKRRSANTKIRVPQYNRCPNCGEPVLSHRVCMSCGYYRGTIVIEVGKET